MVPHCDPGRSRQRASARVSESVHPGEAMNARARALWAALAWAACAAGAGGSLLPLEAEELRASVGGFAVMNCHLDFPFGNEIPYHLQWDKDVSFNSAI